MIKVRAVASRAVGYSQEGLVGSQLFAGPGQKPSISHLCHRREVVTREVVVGISPVPRDIQSQTGQGSEHPDLAVNTSVHCQRVELDNL